MRFTNLELDWLVVAVGLDDAHVFLVLSCDLLILLIMRIISYNLAYLATLDIQSDGSNII